MVERGVVMAALADEVTALEEVLLGLSEDEVVRPTRCAPWDVAALSVHTVGALHQVSVTLDTGAADAAARPVSAPGYYSPRVRFSPEVNGARVRDAAERAARRPDAAEPGRVLGVLWSALRERVAREPEDRTLVTRHGDPMLLTDFLTTRVTELVLHGLDLADALERRPWVSDRGLDLVRELLFGAADRAAVRAVLPDVEGAGALEAVRVVTGRASRRVEREALEAAGVRVLTLG
ncbi:maleylpyruvate isomerase N-terminal domain-containing protein [Nocardiopsis sp. MG754419]|uniref:maleylpyruvate isomerase N-terminal domain-containing protein n=1 Tax=Nocardiopsis sp. MG754419 TaxID=2259865 RepID=UPI0027DAC60C|nr:maleylpyruvate isomerase N-terminal domain-containing protein [Nocardiopsis sp. MG754419]MBR8741513.1 mycothiol maleylpyruvate isomerase [Nocardiopsis sp. MG754419]